MFARLCQQTFAALWPFQDCGPSAMRQPSCPRPCQASVSVVSVTATAKTAGQNGVEMEALTAASVALLTVYDMAKALEKGMIISNVRLLAKSGGKSGDWTAREDGTV